MGYVVVISPIPGFEARRYEVWTRFCRQIRRSMWDTIGGGNLSTTAVLFDNSGLTWERLAGKQALFVRPLLVEGEPPSILLMPWLMVPADTFNEIHADFEPAVKAVGARFRSGETANLIFLAQLTPLS